MMRLVLYSDQIVGKSDEVDKRLIAILNSKNPRIAYIPSCADIDRKYFKQKVEYYSRLGIHDLMYFDLDMEYQPDLLDRLLACNAIHLSGGDTIYFLKSIMKRGFIEVLRNYALNGGVLIGVSAGSIMMSESIDVVEILNEGKLDSSCSEALKLLDFEFVPHWESNNIYIDELKQYSKERESRIYCCSDSDGIVVEDNNISFIGEVIGISSGSASSL